MPPTKLASPQPAGRHRAKDAARPATSGRQPGNARPSRHKPSRVEAVPTSAGAAPLPTISEILADLAEKQARLSALLDAADPTDTATLTKLFSIHAQNASRMGRLLRDQRALSGAAADGIAGAIAQALDELSSELATPL
jgi:hypothetical protein